MVAPVKDTEHIPAERVQEVTENAPPAPLLVQVTLPVGENPITWAVQVEAVPMATEDGSQLTLMVVG